MSWLRTTAAAVLLVAGPAFGEGWIFGKEPGAPVEIQEQRALVVWAEGVEQLVLEAEFRGRGTELVWVVPLPAEAKVSPSTPGLFPTLHLLLLPSVQAQAPRLYLIPLGLLLVLGLFFGVRNHKTAAGVGLLILAAWSVFTGAFRSDDESARSIAFPAGVRPDRERIAAEELLALPADAAADWLRASGFLVPPSAKPPIDAQKRRGWGFLVARLKRGANSNDVQATPSVALTFASPDRPLCPLAAGGGRAEIYLFAPERAEAAGFVMKRCDETRFLPLEHAELARLTGGARLAMLLSGFPSPPDGDPFLRWAPWRLERPAYYTVEAARTQAANVGVTLAVLLLVPAVALLHSMGRSTLKAGLLCSLLALAAGYAVFNYLPKMEARRVDPLGGSIDHEEAGRKVGARAGFDRAAASALCAEFWRGQINPFTEQAVREEDSPGNYTFGEKDGVVHYLQHDRYGRARRR
ncbi:MAG: DUF2330 domain-containing protein [Planctomycetaceae bacterium]